LLAAPAAALLASPAEAVEPAEAAAAAGAAEPVEPVGPVKLANPPHRDFNIVPLVGGSSDIGIGFGQTSDWVRLGPEYHPYRWRLATEAFVTFKARGDNVIVPFQDYSLQLIVPELLPEKRLRLIMRLSFTDEATLKFYGIGNNSPEPPPATPAREAEYGRIHPTLAFAARTSLGSSWFAQVGSVYTHNWLDVPSDSVLGRAQVMGPQDVRDRIGSFARHGVELIEVAAVYDSRDSELVAGEGMYHKLQVRLSPGIPGWLPYAYQQVNLTARFYATPIPRRLTLAWRAVGDVMFGTPPFYELARFDETPAIGGGNAVRGVPAQRYYGKVKLFQNLEARAQLVSFFIGSKHVVLGAALFFDAGRTWTELGSRHPELDGTGLGLKYGVGGGLRLQQGETFVVRADIAWSPDARPIGGYFAAGEIF
jgi:hypothetical protein